MRKQYECLTVIIITRQKAKMTWTKINAQRVCGDYVIAKNACTASNMPFALFNRHGKIVKQFERYDDAIKFYETEIKK